MLSKYLMGAAAAVALAGPAMADNWTMTLTADNFFNAYCGNATQTTTFVGGGGWPTASA